MFAVWDSSAEVNLAVTEISRRVDGLRLDELNP